MEILNKIFLLLISTRAKTIYWNSFYVLSAGVVDLFLQNISNLDLPNWAVVFAGLVLSQISKGIVNRKQGALAGWQA